MSKRFQLDFQTIVIILFCVFFVASIVRSLVTGQ